ncbi:MAG: bifunctional N(6)-L-threonylcarbamoyladenine synthase/serine/threonine protein kinase [Methanosphaera sp.]|uniref:bifunctional N(6)-L-threonylcarbamoyladenine synthase/serine/threonine protein kinase n=1 Tax=Methanosphaera sp. TaxID=2666342 RepID=UPI002600A274|nr:bifunctional N(6)-L-threonylcarbamoyladenine synthase/serine/threonine protein kinase [Methanosphaera sp.]MCI5866724.1 bifunctional N(6)-L-threonylcarbamoyladenine synthase/serine/threonine protein kinase [Methanosphaera sp.]MDD6534239.1 bifunctional N(6)-L-threonylcarbamoyladenine synthase/serine/threonine protein kinase [Methanosphaera sp.]MDY3956377.1 bifunctional N(6)-L-threonylcarbamoyladenine synthase/serine/threonine protein kinase [Methanosphaera sp.]
MIALGIEGTAEKTGIGIVDSDGNILATCGDQLYPEVGGIHPRDAAEFHAQHFIPLIKDALCEANLTLNDIDLVSFSKGPGLGPALRTTATAARSLALNIDVPLIGVNHCIGHVEIGKLTTGATDPVTLYTSGGNTQIISYEAGRYRIIGETLDIAIGNCLDQFSRDIGLGHPGGPVVESHAQNTDETVKLPYVVKGMDLSFSGILTSAINKYKSGVDLDVICNSFQQTCFAMLCEVTERAISYTKKDEVLLCGGVAANKTLRSMLKQMCDEHYVDFYMPPMKYCGDNGSMIARLGLLAYDEKLCGIKNSYINPKFRTDQMEVTWIKDETKHNIKLPEDMIDKGAEADIIDATWNGKDAIIKHRVKKNYRIDEIDDKLRSERLKQEAKLIHDAKNAGIRTPYIYDIDLKNKSLVLQKIDAVQLNDIIMNTTDSTQLYDLFIQIGSDVACMHRCGIIHGDLTTANILIDCDMNPYFIDFGLGRYSELLEDQGVDLLVFKKSLKTLKPEISDELFNKVLKGYDDVKIKNKIDEIEKRGRYL